MEGRALIRKDDKRLEAENAAYVTAVVDFEWLKLSGTYSPSVLVTPLEQQPSVVSLTHTLSGSADASVTFYESSRFVATGRGNASYTQQNFRRTLLGAPLPEAPKDGSIPPPTAPVSDLTPSEAVQVNGFTMRTGTAVGDVTLLERLSRRTSLSEYAAYTVSTGMDADSRVLYPLAHGPRAGVAFDYGLDARTTLTTRADAQLTFVPATDERAWVAGVSEGIGHRFDRRLSGDAAVGFAYTRSDRPGEAPVDSSQPVAVVGLSYNGGFAHGKLYARLEFSYLPILDRTAVVYDPRASAFTNVSWTRRAWTLYANASSSVSTKPENPGSLRSANGNAGTSYDLGAGFAVDAGVRVAWQKYEQADTLPPTWVGFVALSWSYDLLEGQPGR